MRKAKGKQIPNSLLSRDREWRTQVIEHQDKYVDSFNSEQRVGPNCPICSSEAKSVGAVRQVSYLECGDCQHLFCSILPSDLFLDHYYRQENSAQLFTYADPPGDTYLDRDLSLTLPKAQFIHDSRNSAPITAEQEPLWVDIGGGVGDLLVAAKRFGYEATSIEPDPAQGKISRSRGIPVIEAYLTHESDELTVFGDAAVISMLNVLEHIPAPAKILQKIAAQMRGGAVLAVEVPRHPSLSSIIQFANLAPVNRHMNPPEHLHLFSDKSIVKLFENAGLAIEAQWIFGSDALEIFYSVGENLGWEKGFDSNGLPEMINRLQSSIDERGLSDNMLVVGRKQ